MKHFYLVLFFLIWWIRHSNAVDYTDKIRIQIKEVNQDSSNNNIRLDITTSAIIFFENLLTMKTDEANSITY